ncbi:MAG: hypothetical protein KDA37_02960, partial [Planctomycetales bacterium]|nr:hypothetical protein [Planctomycetales bacterium]
MKYATMEEVDPLIYDERPEVRDTRDFRPADEMPTEAERVASSKAVLKPWVLPTANGLIREASEQHPRPSGNPGEDFAFVKPDFDESHWSQVDLPHDWAISGPFMEGWRVAVGGGMGRLPSPGVAWYRKKLTVPDSDQGRSIFLDVDGAMSYAIVWCNGRLVGGWPFGYASWRVDLTPYLNFGGENQLAIRLDNPPDSSRWYPGGGIYRNVWLTKTAPQRVGHWGVFITTPEVSKETATVQLQAKVENESDAKATMEVFTQVFELDKAGNRSTQAVATIDRVTLHLGAGERKEVTGSTALDNPRLWGPPPTQAPHLYEAVTTVSRGGRVVDRVQTRFGVRDVRFDPDHGVYINDQLITIKGANQHHDLGALGAAFHVRAAERQLEMLRKMGCNAIRMSHNPPAPELLDLADRMGFLVIDETFDVWERKKAPLDFHLIFPDWSEPDTRAMVRRDRNHPSVILWSIGNEVGEQYTGEEGAQVARRLHDIVKQEDPTRPTTTAMNFSKPHMPLPAVVEVVSLNYQGE